MNCKHLIYVITNLLINMIVSIYPNIPLKYQKGITTYTKSRKIRYLCGFPALCLLSNSGADRIIQVVSSTHLCYFVFVFSGFYLIFFSHQIIRAKIEPHKAIFSALIAPILIAHLVV